MSEVRCPNCKGVDFAPNSTGGLVCLNCGNILEGKGGSFRPAVYPKCPNKECEYHSNPPLPKEAFAINVIEQGLMGKVFKSESANMISCVNCGHIIGVSGKGG